MKVKKGGGGMGGGGGGGGGGGMGGMMMTKSLSMKSAPLGAMSSSFMKEEKMLSAGGFDDMMDSCEEADDDEADGMMMMGMMEAEACAAPPMAMAARRRSVAAPPPARPKVGSANAARVSRGSMADKVGKTVEVKAPKRDPDQHVTVTVVIYNTVAGGEDMEQLYASCGWKGNLADTGAEFMKKELTVKDTLDIAAKLTSQPYAPPAGAVGLVVGGDVFPTSVS